MVRSRFIPAGAGNARHFDHDAYDRSVHPRRRGERVMPTGAGKTVCGSSPQARGTRGSPCRCPPPRRFIPAGAGNAMQAILPSVAIAVHPRRRGERQRARKNSYPGHGSSPQARGTHRSSTSLITRPRFIPAGAGNAACGSARAATVSVHPRRRGERACHGGAKRRDNGSSPQARGTLRHCPRDRG